MDTSIINVLRKEIKDIVSEIESIAVESILEIFSLLESDLVETAYFLIEEEDEELKAYL